MKTEKNMTTVGADFENKVCDLLRQIGYEVKHDTIASGRQTDIIVVIADKRAYPVQLTFLVECKYRKGRKNLGVKIVNEMSNRLQAAKKRGIANRGWIISNSELTATAKDYAKPLDIIFTRVDHLLGLAMPGFVKIKEELDNDFESYKEDYLEPIGISKSENGENNCPEDQLDKVIKRWLISDDKGSKPILLLGNEGIGKTLYAKKWFNHLAKMTSEGDWSNEWKIPVFIPLEQISKDIDHEYCKNLILNYLEKTNLVTSSKIFIKTVPLLLILDGFDNLFRPLNKLKIKQCLRSLSELHANKTKILITCRTGFFDGFFDDYLTYELFHVFVMMPFTENMLKSYLRNSKENSNLRKSKVDTNWILKIFKKYSIMEIARIPIILALIIQNLKNLPYVIKSDSSAVQILRDIIKLEIRNAASNFDNYEREKSQRVLETVAYDLWQRGRLDVSLDDPEKLKHLEELLHDIDFIDIIKSLEEFTKILKSIRGGIAFAHPLYRDILAADFIFNKFRQTQERNDDKICVKSILSEFVQEQFMDVTV